MSIRIKELDFNLNDVVIEGLDNHLEKMKFKFKNKKLERSYFFFQILQYHNMNINKILFLGVFYKSK